MVMFDRAGVHSGHLRDEGVRSDRCVLIEAFPAKIRYTSSRFPTISATAGSRPLPLIAGLLSRRRETFTQACIWVMAVALMTFFIRDVLSARVPYGDLERAEEARPAA